MSENKRVFCKETRLFHKLKIVDRSGKTASAKKPRAILSTPKSARNYVKYAKNGRRHSPPVNICIKERFLNMEKNKKYARRKAT